MDNISVIEEGILSLWEQTSLLKDSRFDKAPESPYLKQMLQLLSLGRIRACDSKNGKWILNVWVKKGILLLFMTRKSSLLFEGRISYKDKILPFENSFLNEGVRLVPTSYVREGVFLGNNVIVMPSFINIGAYVGENSMIDSYATIGSCAQIGKNCHISSSAVIAGVLEPLQEMPVIIEDGCFIGAGCVISEGVVVRKGAVLGAGVTLTSTTKILDIKSGTISYAEVPPYSVVVPGSVKSSNSDVLLQCAVITKTADLETRKKISINDLLR
jgi:2,3,4,5-tetrahydropyridine-2,6-dicarboxylate N-succinyltransferase